jgi:hypothetical protein
MENFEAVLSDLVSDVQSGRLEIYNEFSLQHELGIKLRQTFSPYKTQFERNTSFFFADSSGFVKREIDIAVFDAKNRHPVLAVELKFPRNGQVPEQMFSFCKDIAFVEQLVAAGFVRGASLVFADDPLFYSGSGAGIYGYFRAGMPIAGTITKPTGKKDETVTIKGPYRPVWKKILGNLSYSLIKNGAW